ncbi:MAG: hypothetical protein LKJ80_00625 [Oscillibacter sp.]|jgi:hypothetical protein|nr:hypothetical protein [Oscillibacter sp.]
MLSCFSRLTPAWLKRAYVYTGSVGPFGSDFRYRWEVDEKEHAIHAAVYSRVCYELAQDVEKRDFSWDDAGVEALKEWLQSRCDAFAPETADIRREKG